MAMTLIFIASLASLFVYWYSGSAAKEIENQPSLQKRSSPLFFCLLLAVTAALAGLEIWGTVTGEINKEGVNWTNQIRPIIFIGTCVALSMTIRREKSTGRSLLWMKVLLALVALVAFLITFVGF